MLNDAGRHFLLHGPYIIVMNKNLTILKLVLRQWCSAWSQSDKSGIAFSIDPVTNDKTKIVIEAIFGLGEYIVQGKVTPDHYEVDKRSFVLLMKDVKYQNLKYVRSGLGNKEIKLFKSEGAVQKLSVKEIVEVALLVKQIEDHYYFPQDIEWAIEGDTVFIVQSRPITTTHNSSGDSVEGTKKKSSLREHLHLPELQLALSKSFTPP